MLYVLYVFLSDPPFHLGPSMTIHQEAYDRWLQQTGHQAADDITVLVVDLTAREAKEPCGQTLAETWYPQIIHFNRVFHYKPPILGYPYFWNISIYPYENHL